MITKNGIVKQWVIEVILWILIIGLGLFAGYRLIFTHIFDMWGLLCLSWGAFFIQVRETQNVKTELTIAQNMLSMIEANKPGIIDEVTQKYLDILQDIINEDNER